MLRHGLPFAMLLLVVAACSETTGPRRVSKFGPLAEGASIPGFAAFSMTGSAFDGKALGGRFHVYYVSDAMPSVCLDAECGYLGRNVAERGGHFVGACDEKLARSFGLEPLPRLNESLLVVADRDARVVAIYRHPEERDVETLVAASF